MNKEMSNESVSILCRLCGKSNDSLNDIFAKNAFTNSITLEEKISFVVGITISKDDIITTKICSQCEKMIEMMYDFRKIAHQVNLMLLSQVEALTSRNEETPAIDNKENKVTKNELKKSHNDLGNNKYNEKKNKKNTQVSSIYSGLSDESVRIFREKDFDMVMSKYIELSDEEKSKTDQWSKYGSSESNSTDCSTLDPQTMGSKESESPWEVEFPLEEEYTNEIQLKSIVTRPYIEKIERKFNISVDPHLSDFDYEGCFVKLEKLVPKIMNSSVTFLSVRTKQIENRRNRKSRCNISCDDQNSQVNAYCIPLRLKSLSLIPALRYTRDNVGAMFSVDKTSESVRSNCVEIRNGINNSKEKYSRRRLHFKCRFCDRRFKRQKLLLFHINSCHIQKSDRLNLKISRLKLSNRRYRSLVLDHTGTCLTVTTNKYIKRLPISPIPTSRSRNEDVETLPIITFDETVDCQTEIVENNTHLSLDFPNNTNIFNYCKASNLRNISSVNASTENESINYNVQTSESTNKNYQNAISLSTQIDTSYISSLKSCISDRTNNSEEKRKISRTLKEKHAQKTINATTEIKPNWDSDIRNFVSGGSILERWFKTLQNNSESNSHDHCYCKKSQMTQTADQSVDVPVSTTPKKFAALQVLSPAKINMKIGILKKNAPEQYCRYESNSVLMPVAVKNCDAEM